MITAICPGRDSCRRRGGNCTEDEAVNKDAGACAREDLIIIVSYTRTVEIPLLMELMQLRGWEGFVLEAVKELMLRS